MEKHKFTSKDLTGLDSKQLQDLEIQIRKETTNLRINVFEGQEKKSNKEKDLRKSLARVLTFKSMLKSNTTNSSTKA